MSSVSFSIQIIFHNTRKLFHAILQINLQITENNFVYLLFLIAKNIKIHEKIIHGTRNVFRILFY